MISTFALGSIALDKVISKKIPKSKPYLRCPEYYDAKMKTAGKWVCENCNKSFY